MLIEQIQLLLEIVIQNQNQCTRDRPYEIGIGPVEKRLESLLPENDPETVQWVFVELKFLLFACLHHHSTAGCVNWVGHELWNCYYSLCHEEIFAESCITSDHSFSHVEKAEVQGAVKEDSKGGNAESLVKTLDSICFDDLGEAVTKSGKLSLRFLPDISCEPCPCKIQWIHKQQRGKPGHSTSCQIPNEKLPKILLLLMPDKYLLILILACKSYCSCRKIPNNIRPISSPKWGKTLFFDTSSKTVYHSFVRPFEEFRVLLCCLD